MAHLLIKIEVKVPLPKERAAAVQRTLEASQVAHNIARELYKVSQDGQFSVTQHDDDTDPAPAPKKRGRKPRAALGSSPLNVELRDPVAESAQTTAVAHGAPGDDLDIPGFLRREAKP